MGARRVAVLFLIAGGLLALALLKLLVLPGLLEFLLITLGHLVLAAAVLGLSWLAIRDRPLGLALGLVWGAGWLLFHLRELTMLFFVLPPPWATPLSEWMILGGGLAAGVTAALRHRGSHLERIAVPRWTTAAVAVLSALYLWLPGLIGDAWSLPSGGAFAVNLAIEGVVVLSVIGTGVLLLVASLRGRRG